MIYKKPTIKIISLATFLGTALLLCLLHIPLLYQPLARHAQHSMEQQFGATPIAPEHEATIKAIADRMGINQPIIIRKMNSQTLLAMGYYNAFAAFHLFGSLLPLVDTPFLFISEGFFEDLTEQEQTFLIGHELTHIQEHHTRYLHLLSFLFFILLFALLWHWGMRRYLIPLLSKPFNPQYHYGITTLCFLVTFWSCSMTNRIITSAYRRSIEWQADENSLTTLASHQGGIDLMNRWQREYKIAAANPYGGLLADHPSCVERSAYCKEHQNLT